MKPQEPAPFQSISQWRSHASVVLQAYFDLALVLGFTLITLIFIATPYLNATPVRSIAGLLFILLVPGYASIAALFPSKTDLGNIERGTLSFGVSIVEGGLVGFGLNYTPWGIGLQSVVIVLLVLIIGGVAVSFRRRNALPPADRFAVSLVEVGSIFKQSVAEPNSRRYRMLNVVIVASLIISLSSLAYLVAMPHSGETFTVLYVLDPAGKTKDYPANFTLGETKSVVVGVTNDEQREMTYDFVVKLNDSQQATTLYTQKIMLANNQTWQDTVPLTPDRTGTDMKLQFLLYRSSDQAAPYREAHLWVNVTKS